MNSSALGTRRAFVLCTIAAGITFAAGPSRAGTTYYVNDGSTDGDAWCSAPGNDAHSGTAPDAPKATVQDLLADYDLEPGDTICVDAGYYLLTGSVIVGHSDGGTTDSWVTIRGRPGGTVLDGSLISSGAVIALNYVTGVRLCDLSLSNASVGVVVNGGSAYYAISNVTIRGAADSAVYLENASHGDLAGLDLSGAGDGIRMYNSSLNRIANCAICNNGGHGIRASYHSGDNQVVNCTVAFNGAQQIWMSCWETEMDVRNSIVVASGSGNACIKRFETVYYGSHGEEWRGAGTYSGDYNDLCAINGADVGQYASVSAPWTTVHFANLSEWRANRHQDTNSLSADPLFVDAAAGDLHLRSSAPSGTFVAASGSWIQFPGEDSPCIDAGDPASSCAAEPDWNGGVVNLGAYGNTPHASRSVDADGDTLSDTFERYRFGSDPLDADSDDDGERDDHEYVAGMDPHDRDSVFEAAGVRPADGSGDLFVIQWPSAAGRRYRLEGAARMGEGYEPVASDLPATPAVNAYTVNVSGVDHRIYRIGVER